MPLMVFSVAIRVFVVADVIAVALSGTVAVFATVDEADFW